MLAPTLPAPIAAPTSQQRAPLAVIRKLFDRLHGAGIRYCQWKSNQHLDASMVGATDFDLLVDRRDASRFAEILAQEGVKPFRKIAGDEYPGVEDYLAFDTERGALSHVHVHYQLTLGEKFLKGYRLPWEREALAARRFDTEHGLWVMDPRLELLLLVTRAAIKLRARDWVLAAAGRPYMSGGWLLEFRWLVERISIADLCTITRALVGEVASRHLAELVQTAVPSTGQLRRYRRAVEPRLASYRMYGAVDGLRRRFMGEAGWVIVAAVNHRRGLEYRSTRVSPRGGLSVCVIGTQRDATNLARQLSHWLSTDMAVIPDLGETTTTAARQGRDRGKIVIADRFRPHAAVPPDLALALGDAMVAPNHPRTPARVVRLDGTDSPARLLLQAKCALWHSI